MQKSTTLINELMMGADAWSRLANEDVPGLMPIDAKELYHQRMTRAVRMRARAEVIRDAENQLNAQWNNLDMTDVNATATWHSLKTLFEILTGDTI